MAAGCVGTFLEAGIPGPYTAWYIRHRQALIPRTGLIGRSDAEVERVLGRPTRIDDVPAPSIVHADGRVTLLRRPYRRFTYAPYSWLPFNHLVVFSEDGIVTSFRVRD
jgi:hypothetical protein